MIPLNTKRKLGATDVKYKIICAGKEFDIGLNKPVKVEFRGHVYQAKMHSKTKGRIDGLGQLYVDFDLSEGHELQLFYMEDTNTILLDEELVMPDEDPEPQDINVSKIQQQIPQNGDNFNGEFYRGGLRSIARYGDTCYFAYDRSLITCEYGNMEKHELIGYKKFPKVNQNQPQIFVNEYGIFIYGFNTDRGTICSLFDHEGKLKGSFEISKNGPKYAPNYIVDGYIVRDSFYCVSQKEFFVHRFNSDEEYRSNLVLPEGKKVIGLVVGEHQVYLKLKDGGYEQWYKLLTDPTLSFTNGQISPLFKDIKTANIPFLHPRQNIAWIASYEDEADCSFETLCEKRSNKNYYNHWTYAAYDIENGKYAGKTFHIKTKDTNPENVVYFDGKNMLLLWDGVDSMSVVDLETGEEKYYGSIFVAHKFSVLYDRLYVLRDYHEEGHYIASILLEPTLSEEVKLCRRIW